MSQSSNQAQDQTSYEYKFSSSSASEGALTLPASINGNEFQLVYQAREEPIGSNKLLMGKNIVDFAKSYSCGYVLIIDDSCWISPDKGISLLTQIEHHEKLDKYNFVVLPLDDSTYIAKINDGIVVEERVRPTEQVITYLQKNKNAEIAILAGGEAYETLAKHNFLINCDSTLFTVEPEAANYRFKSIKLALISKRLFHHSLLIPLILTAIFLLVIALRFTPLYSIDTDKIDSFSEQEMTSNIAPAIPEVKPKKPKEILKNNATQFFNAITPWVTGKTIDFLRTCRLKTILLSNEHLIFIGERMSNIKINQLGCGNKRLNTVIQDNGLIIKYDKNSWMFKLPIETSTEQNASKEAYSKIIERLELISEHIDWRFNIQPPSNKKQKSSQNIKVLLKQEGDQLLKVLFQGESLNPETIYILSHGLSQYATNFIEGSLQFNPKTSDLSDAQFEINIHTQSSITL